MSRVALGLVQFRRPQALNCLNELIIMVCLISTTTSLGSNPYQSRLNHKMRSAYCILFTLLKEVNIWFMTFNWSNPNPKEPVHYRKPLAAHILTFETDALCLVWSSGFWKEWRDEEIRFPKTRPCFWAFCGGFSRINLCFIKTLVEKLGTIPNAIRPQSSGCQRTSYSCSCRVAM